MKLKSSSLEGDNYRNMKVNSFSFWILSILWTDLKFFAIFNFVFVDGCFVVESCAAIETLLYPCNVTNMNVAKYFHYCYWRMVLQKKQNSSFIKNKTFQGNLTLMVVNIYMYVTKIDVQYLTTVIYLFILGRKGKTKRNRKPR